jgi:RNA polymerase sigma-70 factor, ECF subfamily
MVLYQKGDLQAFQILYQRHAGKIFGFIKNRVKKDERARDVFQEVFLKMHRSKHLYNQTLPVLPWIFTLTKNVLIDNVRKEKLIVDLNVEELPAPQANRKLQEEVLPHLSKLPMDQKVAVQMRYVEDKTFEDIAKVLDTTELNVRQMISRGIRRLRNIIGGDSAE